MNEGSLALDVLDRFPFPKIAEMTSTASATVTAAENMHHEQMERITET
jgi:hypothetical protein